MGVDGDAAPLEPGLECRGRRLFGIARDDHRAHLEVPLAEIIDEFEDIRMVGDAKIQADFPVLDVARIYADDDFRLVAELVEQAHLDVRVEPRQHPRRMVVEQQLPAEFEVELVIEARHTIQDGRRLFGQIAVVVKGPLVG